MKSFGGMFDAREVVCGGCRPAGDCFFVFFMFLTVFGSFYVTPEAELHDYGAIGLMGGRLW